MKWGIVISSRDIKEGRQPWRAWLPFTASETKLLGNYTIGRSRKLPNRIYPVLVIGELPIAVFPDCVGNYECWATPV